MRFDACAKIGQSYKGTAYLKENYMQEMRKNGISKALIVSEKPLSYNIAEANDYVEKVLKEDAEHFIGAVRVDPWNTEQTQREIKERFKNPLFKAIYLNPWEENFQINREVIRPVLTYAQKEKKPVIVEAGYVWVSHITQIAEVAAEYPDVKFLMLNAAQMDLSGYTLTDVKHFMGKRKNLYLGTNSAVAAEWLVNLYRDSSPGRILFCSNYPFFEVDLECARIELCYFTEEEKNEIFFKNAEKFFG